MGDLLQFAPFDFALIRFEWTGGGTDLDTRTKITTPNIGGAVGWSRLNKVGNFLTWGGDNTGDGEEGILIDFKSLSEAYPENEVLSVQLSAFWYAALDTGDFNLIFETYEGGTMEPANYSFVNVGGALVQRKTLGRNSQTHISADIDGDKVGQITYTPATRRAAFV
tara:strand:- start:178 stop:675 length:498 start_codon:yes stop_codon:yes gene_type:complete